MKIILTQNSAPAEYAGQELAKYAFLMMGGNMPSVTYEKSCKTDEEDTIRLGLLSDFDLPTDDVQDAVIEDVVDIKVNCGSGYIAGSNARSILMGVYQYLKSAGCLWVRPGIEGEYIPKGDLSAHSYTYRKKADYLFRGECSEGAISYEHFRDMIYWLPKVGMNMFMNEGRVPFNYMHRWYGHASNKYLYEKGCRTNYDAMTRYIDWVEADMLKTGVQYHNMGHGWMFEEFGLTNGNTLASTAEIPEENKQYLALFRGKRDFVEGIPFYTNICYSNPVARKKLVDFWVKYAKEKPYVDYFHVWLADGINCCCECDECKKTEISDLYVLLLNEIDEALTQNGIKARLVLIMYKETLRPPKMLKINNPARFTMLYTAGGLYEKPYKMEKYEGEVPPYVHNQFTVPSSALKMKWYGEWKQCAKAPAFVYEYRYYMDHYCDLGYMQVARETYRDMKALKDIDLQGCMSDLTLRCFLPTGLPLALMGETLFDSNLDYEEYCNDYFRAAFGEDGAKCRDYLEKMSELFSMNLLRHDVKVNNREEEGFTELSVYENSWFSNPKAAENFAKIPALIDDFMPTIEANRHSSDICHNKSWDYLKYHAHIAKEMSKAYLEGAKGDKAKGAEIFLELHDWMCRHEMEFAPVFDLHLFEKFNRGKFGLERSPEFD